jgi:hypothetical protein
VCTATTSSRSGSSGHPLLLLLLLRKDLCDAWEGERERLARDQPEHIKGENETNLEEEKKMGHITLPTLFSPPLPLLLLPSLT